MSRFGEFFSSLFDSSTTTNTWTDLGSSMSSPSSGVESSSVFNAWGTGADWQCPAEASSLSCSQSFESITGPAWGSADSGSSWDSGIGSSGFDW